MGKEDVLRYYEEEVPDMGVIENKPASLVCASPDCDELITVDPETLVPEDDGAVEVNPFDLDGEPTQKVQVYCSGECRNDYYSNGRVLSSTGDRKGSQAGGDANEK